MRRLCITIIHVFVTDNEVLASDTDTVVDEYSGGAELKLPATENNQSRLIENNRFSTSTGIPYTPKSRKKRSSSSEYVVELMIVADKKMAEYHGEELHNYILTLMSIVIVFENDVRLLTKTNKTFTNAQVSKIYKDKSIGNPMHIAVVKLVILRDVHFVENRNRLGGIAAADMLHKFCEWQMYHNDENDSSENHHDAALLLTRY